MPGLNRVAQCLVLPAQQKRSFPVITAACGVERDWGPFPPNLSPAVNCWLLEFVCAVPHPLEMGRNSAVQDRAVQRESHTLFCSVLLLVLQKCLPFFSAFTSNYHRCNFVLNEKLSTKPFSFLTEKKPKPKQPK